MLMDSLYLNSYCWLNKWIQIIFKCKFLADLWVHKIKKSNLKIYTCFRKPLNYSFRASPHLCRSHCRPCCCWCSYSGCCCSGCSGCWWWPLHGGVPNWVAPLEATEGGGGNRGRCWLDPHFALVVRRRVLVANSLKDRGPAEVVVRWWEAAGDEDADAAGSWLGRFQTGPGLRQRLVSAWEVRLEVENWIIWIILCLFFI